jgi:hypothetical protein
MGVNQSPPFGLSAHDWVSPRPICSTLFRHVRMNEMQSFNNKLHNHWVWVFVANSTF